MLDELDKFQFKATFFCIGNNVEKYPNVYNEILRRGHCVANHTFNHLRGFSTKNEDYFENINQCENLVKSKYFRPPHGQLKFSQIRYLKKRFSIVMWSLLAEDWNPNLNLSRKIFELIKNTSSGDIIVFHDSEKARKNLEFLLPEYLKFLSNENFTSKVFE